MSADNNVSGNDAVIKNQPVGSGEFDVAGRQGQKWSKITVDAPYDSAPSAFISIEVRELRGKELGALASPDFERHAQKAVDRKSAEDFAAYGKTTQMMEEDSKKSGYFGSPAHAAWAEAAEARTGGRLSSEWWMKFDPYGGTNGNGPKILFDGAYPGGTSRIGMAHDTDWSLGRHFQAGPLKALYGAGHDPKTLGLYGLDPGSPIQPRPDLYTLNGHSDWKVGYHNVEKIPFSAQRGEVEDRPPSTLVSDNKSLNMDFAQALKGTNGDRDAAALAVDTIRNAPGYKEGQDISVVQGKNGNFIVSQGQGDTALNVPVPQAKQGDFERVSSQLALAPQPQSMVQPLDQSERARSL
jgi:hypothetical protein